MPFFVLVFFADLVVNEPPIPSLLGLFFGEQAVSGEIQHELKDALGNDTAKQLQAIIKNQHTQHNGFITTIIGFFTLALSASGMFSQIHNLYSNPQFV